MPGKLVTLILAGTILAFGAGAQSSAAPAKPITGIIDAGKTGAPISRADQPKVNAGSPTYPVDVTAALTSDGKSLTVAIVNPNEAAQELDLSLKGISLTGKGRKWRTTGPSLTAATGLNRKEVQVTESPVTGAPDKLSIAPISINIYEFEEK